MENNASLSLQVVDTLESEIREALAEAMCGADKTRRVAEETIASAVRAGQRMLDAKSHLKGGFGKWLDERFDGSSRQYLNRFQQLADAVNRGLQLQGHASLRQAFIAAGILPPAARDGAQAPSGGNSCPWISALSRTWETVQKLKPEEMKDTDREQLRTRLKPLAELYAKLAVDG